MLRAVFLDMYVLILKRQYFFSEVPFEHKKGNLDFFSFSFTFVLFLFTVICDVAA